MYFSFLFDYSYEVANYFLLVDNLLDIHSLVLIMVEIHLDLLVNCLILILMPNIELSASKFKDSHFVEIETSNFIISGTLY